MSRRYAYLIVVALAGLACFGFIAKDSDPLKELLTKLEKYRSANIYEKVHLHTDKPYYSVGDTIWLKAYLVISGENKPSGLSRILYVDLINESNAIRQSLRLPVNSGLAHGDFVLSDSLHEGNYRLRAYTTWMRNYGEEYFFDKTIQIGNSLSNQLISEVKYSYSKTGIKENVTADITYRDINGKALAGKEVTYSIQLDSRNILTGKGITDKDGHLKIKFINAQPFVLKSGTISTTVKLDENTLIKKSIPVKTTSEEIDVQFFPEGGQLVNGLPSRVGFKAIGSDGLSREIQGYIIDSQNNKITDFETEHAGIGTLVFTPEKGNSYQALIKFKSGSEKKVDLPKAANEGYILSVQDGKSDNINVRIATTRNLLSEEELTLVAQSNGRVHYIARANLSGTTFKASLPKKRFPNGIIQFTLFSSKFRPVAERLVFIRNEARTLDINSDKPVYNKREKVNLSFLIRDTTSENLKSNFSLAVINETLIPYDDTKETTILSNLLLSSDLRGYIENPNYYFSGNDENRIRHLDNLLMTQGWRRFSWNNIIDEAYPAAIFYPEHTITISGRVTNANGNPTEGGKVSLLPSKGDGVIMDTVTNAEGRFIFEGLKFNDSTSFVIRARNAKDKKNVYIEIDRLPAQLVSRNKNAPNLEVNVNQNLITYLQARKDNFDILRKLGLYRKSIVLAEVTIAEKKPVVANSSNLNGAGNADAIIRADQLRDCLSLPQCLGGMVAGLVVQNGIAYSTRSMYTSFTELVPMQLIVDGMYLTPDYLGLILPDDVETIEVLKSIGNTAIYGIRGGGGVLVINTKRGERNLSYRNLTPGTASYKPLGLYTARDFYSPVYPAPVMKSTLPDLRNTIFWAPNVSTDDQGKANAEFYTSDVAGTYKVTVEGIGHNGSLFRNTFRFKVE